MIAIFVFPFKMVFRSYLFLLSSFDEGPNWAETSKEKRRGRRRKKKEDMTQTPSKRRPKLASIE